MFLAILLATMLFILVVIFTVMAGIIICSEVLDAIKESKRKIKELKEMEGES